MRFFSLFVLSACASAQTGSGWTLANTSHFEVYSQAGADTARSTLLWLEQLRALFLQQTGIPLDGRAPVRVVAFRSPKEYEPYRLRVASDAYFVGAEARDYIVMPSGGTASAGVAAHEYAHALLRAGGLRLPPWLAEGLAEFFSTVRIAERGSYVGGDLPARSLVLRQKTWMPLPQVFAINGESPARENRDQSALFYAQSWALADMLMRAPEYQPKFTLLIAALSSGQSGAQALLSVYGRSLNTITRDLRSWTAARHPALALPGVAPGLVTPRIAAVSAFVSRSLIAELLAAIGEHDRAETLYRELAREAPADAAIPAALGAIALQRGDHDGARREWKHAIELGVNDAAVCYRYATLASAASLPPEEVRRAYERAVELKPDYDDALYALALLEKNIGEYEAALAHLRAMPRVGSARAFHYWCAMADALTNLGRRDEAVSAAKEASQRAASSEERNYAGELAWVAQTEIGVRLTRDAEGRAQMVTTRVPRGAADWNPFIEPGDNVKKTQGTLREIDCAGPVTRFVVETPGGKIMLSIPDPGRLQARNAPAEFTCGPQDAPAVTVVYAAGAPAEGILRGIEFR